jgi:MFS family permease
MMHRSYSAPVTAAAGLIALVVAMGIGRFAFTPILPMMQEDAGLSVAEGGWLAASNYAGYLLGAIFATGYRISRLVAVVAGLLMIGVTTLAMGLGDNFIVWNVLRFLAGVASAWVLIAGSSWCLERLAALRRPRLSGVVFAGVGIGIVVAGIVCLLLMQWNVGSATAWIIFGVMSLLLTGVVWPVFRPADLTHPPSPDLSSFPWSADALRLVFCYGISGFGYIIPATFLPAMAREVIRDPSVFGWSWPVFGIAAMVSTLAAAVLTAHFSNRRLWAVGHVVMAVGVALPVFWSGIVPIMFAGLFVGGTFMVIVMVALREARDVGGAHATSLIGAITASFALGQIIGPISVSYLIKATGSFSVTLLVASALLVVSAVALLRPVPTRRKR